jgi:hypothetical protein
MNWTDISHVGCEASVAVTSREPGVVGERVRAGAYGWGRTERGRRLTRCARTPGDLADFAECVGPRSYPCSPWSGRCSTTGRREPVSSTWVGRSALRATGPTRTGRRVVDSLPGSARSNLPMGTSSNSADDAPPIDTFRRWNSPPNSKVAAIWPCSNTWAVRVGRWSRRFCGTGRTPRGPMPTYALSGARSTGWMNGAVRTSGGGAASTSVSATYCSRRTGTPS